MGLVKHLTGLALIDGGKILAFEHLVVCRTEQDLSILEALVGDVHIPGRHRAVVFRDGHGPLTIRLLLLLLNTIFRTTRADSASFSVSRRWLLPSCLIVECAVHGLNFRV